jgi:hypothetical protein
MVIVQRDGDGFEAYVPGGEFEASVSDAPSVVEALRRLVDVLEGREVRS